MLWEKLQMKHSKIKFSRTVKVYRAWKSIHSGMHQQDPKAGCIVYLVNVMLLIEGVRGSSLTRQSITGVSSSDRPYYTRSLQSICLVRGELSPGKRSPSF